MGDIFYLFKYRLLLLPLLLLLASCLINAQPIPAHRPAADDNSLIGCTSHDLTDDWSLPVPISLTACTHFVVRLVAFFYRTTFL